MTRALSTIASDIMRTWRKPHFAAMPYIQAMRACHTLADNYGADSAQSIVRYFLANADTWRGPDARRIKLELHAMLREYDKKAKR